MDKDRAVVALRILDSVPQREQIKIARLMHGSGYGNDILDSIKKWYGTKYEYSKTSKKTLKEYGNAEVVELNIYRRPLSSAVIMALNGASFGLWNKLQKEYGIDKFFHLSLVATVFTSKGYKNIIIEKNEVVNISADYKTYPDTEVFPVKKKCKVTLASLMEITRRAVGLKRFYEYDAFYNNCQWFIRYILQNNCGDMYTPEIQKFLFQDISEMVKKLPSYIHPLSKKVTDLGAFASRMTGGRKEIEKRDQELYHRFLVAMNEIY